MKLIATPSHQRPTTLELISMARAAEKDERLSDGALYGKLAAEIEYWMDRTLDAEIGLMTYDDGLNSEYWVRHHPDMDVNG